MKKLHIILFIGLFASCTTKRNLTYFSDLSQDASFKSAVINTYEPKIQVGDILSIVVSSLDPSSNALFNSGVVNSDVRNSGSETMSIGRDGYLIGKDGAVNFPVIGKIILAGSTLNDATEIIRGELKKYVKEPIVNIRYLNFKVTVVGEVNRPGSFNVSNERMTVLEALGNAGDMTGYGKRENVLVIRESNGERTMARLDLNNSSALKSPFFYLQQNDLVYVQSDVLKEKQVSRDNYLLATSVSIVTIITLVLTRIF